MKKLVLRILAVLFLISVLFVIAKGFNIFEKKTQIQPEVNLQKRDDDSAAGSNIVLAAGDIAFCEMPEVNAKKTAKILQDFSGPILTLGDTVYSDGTKEEFDTCFTPTWGKYKNRIFPAVGNHEYHTKDAKPYYDYFGKRAGEPDKGYYSFDLESWHIIAVNTQFMDRAKIDTGVENDEQLIWLEKDLAKNKANCTLVYGHHPLFSSGITSSTDGVYPMWKLLYSKNVDVVLAGHAHIYERFLPQDPEGKADQKYGITEFVVGTGGASLDEFIKAKNLAVVSNSQYGVLKLNLKKESFEWEFLSVNGDFIDKGKTNCH